MVTGEEACRLVRKQNRLSALCSGSIVNREYERSDRESRAQAILHALIARY